MKTTKPKIYAKISGFPYVPASWARRNAVFLFWGSFAVALLVIYLFNLFNIFSGIGLILSLFVWFLSAYSYGLPREDNSVLKLLCEPNGVFYFELNHQDQISQLFSPIQITYSYIQVSKNSQVGFRVFIHFEGDHQGLILSTTWNYLPVYFENAIVHDEKTVKKLTLPCLSCHPRYLSQFLKRLEMYPIFAKF